MDDLGSQSGNCRRRVGIRGTIGRALLAPGLAGRIRSRVASAILASRRWWRRLKRRQKAARWLWKRRRRLPVSYGIYWAELYSNLGLWFAGLNGAGYVLACALMIASYTTAADTCVSQRVTAETLKGGGIFCFLFLSGGVGSLIAASLPGLVGWVRNTRREHKIRQRLPPISFGQELLRLSEGQVQWITGVQTAFLVPALLLFLSGAVTPFVYGISITPDGFRAYWINAAKACAAEAPKPPT